MQNFDGHRLIHDTKVAAQSLFPVKESAITEAVAASYGYRTSAAMWPDTTGARRHAFSESAFIRRMAASTNDLTARSLTAILAGYRMRIDFNLRADRRGDLETVCDVKITVLVPPGRVLPPSVRFRLPEFGSLERENYRIDADYTHRVDDNHAVTRGRLGRQPLDTELQAGQWSGAVFIYHPSMRANPSDCLNSVRSAMARIILSKFQSILDIDVYRPDSYTDGAWRVVAHAGQGVRDTFQDGAFIFDFPDLAPQHIIIGTYDPQHMANPAQGRFVDGAFAIDVHPQGRLGESSPETMEAVRRRFAEAALTRFAAAGIYV